MNIYSLKNVFYPEKIVETDCDVTALRWSPEDENILLVGQSDGNVFIHDVNKNQTVAKSSTQIGKHQSVVTSLAFLREKMGELA